jgi:hypothetical protein
MPGWFKGNFRECPRRSDAPQWLGCHCPHFVARAEPEAFLDLADRRLLVTGRYRGRGNKATQRWMRPLPM